MKDWQRTVILVIVFVALLAFIIYLNTGFASHAFDALTR